MRPPSGEKPIVVSGLIGISGLSSDMREILAAAKSGHERAKLAIDIYIHRLRSGIGALIAVLGGLDALVFTAGVGENSPEVRSAACAHLAFLGLGLDEEENSQSFWGRGCLCCGFHGARSGHSCPRRLDDCSKVLES